MKFADAQDTDGNYRVIGDNEAFKLESTWTFVENLTGNAAAHTLFTVTGNVIATVFGICDTNLSTGATIEVGVASNTASIIAQVADSNSLDDGMIWVDATPAVGAETLPEPRILNDGTDIILTIGTADLTAGVVDFYCLYRPLSSDGAVSVTTPA